MSNASRFLKLSSLFGLLLCGLLIGLMIMLQNMSDPAMIGPALAVALLTQFYAVLLATLSIVSASICTSRMVPQLASAETNRNGSHALARLAPATAVGCLGVLLCFVLILATFA